MKFSIIALMVCAAISLSFAEDGVDTIHYQLGMKYAKEKKYDAAIEEFRKMLTLFPEHAPAYFQMGLAWNAQGKYALGAYNLKKANKITPSNPVILKALSESYAKNNEPEKAMAALRECINAETDPEKKAADEKEITQLLEAVKKGGAVPPPDTAAPAKPGAPSTKAKAEPSVPAPAVVPAGKPVSVPAKAAVVEPAPKGAVAPDVSTDSLLKGLVEKYNAGLWDDVLAEAKRLLKKNRGYSGAYYYAGVARYKKGDLKDAIINFQKGAAYPDKGVNAYYYLGMIHESLGNTEEALSAYQQFLNKSQNPKDKEEVKLRMTALLKKVRSAPAAGVLSGTKPKASVKPLAGAVVPDDTGRPAPFRFKVADNLEFTIEDTLQKEGRKMLSALDLFLDSRFDEALNELKALYREAPRSREADNVLYNTGLIYSRMRLWDNACTYLNKVQGEYPRGDASAAAWVLKGYALAESGALDSSLSHCEAYLKEHPQDKYTGYLHALMGNIYFRKNDFKNALKMYLTALGTAKTADAKADLNYKIGECYFKEGSTRGIDYFRQAAGDTALKIDAVMESCYRLGDYYYKIKNMEGALKYYRQATDRFPQSVNTSWGLYQIANIFKKGGRFDDAVKAYDRLLSAYPEDYWALQAKWQREDAVWENEYKEVLK